ncbi:MAG: dihydroneopterin aldolase [Fibrobacteraceae bacterium]|nr:dihydroneopterin aldolase [Fibrobacteraceae bacterium]
MVVQLGKIEIKDLGFECILGTLPFERIKPQPIVLNISIEFDFYQAAVSENIECTVDYAKLASEIREYVCESKFQLLEALTFNTGKFILEKYPRVKIVSVRVEKPLAIPGAKSASAEILLKR